MVVVSISPAIRNNVSPITFTLYGAAKILLASICIAYLDLVTENLILVRAYHLLFNLAKFFVHTFYPSFTASVEVAFSLKRKRLQADPLSRPN